MARYENGGGGSVLLAFLAGAVTGAAVALLFAPAAGDETRQFLADKARESRERALQAARDGRERALQAARDGRERVTEAAREGRDVLKRQRDQIATAIDRGREAYTKARSGEESA